MTERTARGYTCIAYTEAGVICGADAATIDPQRGGMVCEGHAPPDHRPTPEEEESHG